MCDSIMLDGRIEQLTQQRREAVIDDYRRMAGRGERGLGYAWRFVSAEKAYWHDQWSGTRLVVIPKKGGT